MHAAAIWNANFSAGLPAVSRRHPGLGKLPARLRRAVAHAAEAHLPGLGQAVPDHRTAFDWLSRDPAEVDKYVADPLCGWDASVSMWRDLFGFVFFGADDRNFRSVRKNLPFNLVGGEKDPATDGGKAVTILLAHARMGFSNLTSKVYAETRHESLNEVNRNIITEDFAAWAGNTCV